VGDLHRRKCRRAQHDRAQLGTDAASALVATFGEVAVEPARSAETPRFANDAERECARLLDFYGVPWRYEPRTFALEEAEDGRITEAFTPDFYLPEQDLYVEVTVMKQALVTRKNRKLRKLRERYPDVRIKLFYRRDIERLAQKFKLDLAR
jgi:hypoxanthine phosphoribosyltransferase